MANDKIDFGTSKVSTLFKQIFIPTLFGMLCVSAMTTIDGIYIGHGVGSDGVAAVNICVPPSMIFTGVGLMVGMGCSVVSSVYLSKGKKALARANITQALLFVTIVAGIADCLMMIFPRTVGYMLGSSDHLIDLVVDYLVWFSPSILFTVWESIALFALRLDGSPRLAMWCTIAAAVCNIFLDWLFIFPLGMGLKGAAIATSISCFIGASIAILYLMFYARSLRMHKLVVNMRGLRFFINDILEQCKIGSSALLGEATMAVLMFVGNLVFMHYLGDDGVGAFGIACYFLPFVFMIGNSIAQSVQPIISFNYGIGFMDRVREAEKIAVKVALGCGLFVTVIFNAFPRLLVGMFLDTSSNAAQIAINGFPYFSVGFMAFTLNLTFIGYYQSIERVRPATVYSLMRGVVCLIPCFILLPMAFGTTGIWIALSTSEYITAIIIVTVLIWHRTKAAIAKR